MSPIRVQLAMFFLCLCTCECITGYRSLFPLKGDSAKNKFCIQKYFDTVAFDGEGYRFTVNRRDIAKGRYTFELFKLKYDHRSDSFEYSSSTIDNDNLVPLGGFYLQQLNVYFEFYKNAANARLSYCAYSSANCSSSVSQSVERCTDDCHSLNDVGDHSLYRRIIFCPEAIRLLKSGKQCVFAYDPKLEKIFYIFSDKNSPVAINSLRTVSTQHGSIPWFTKAIDSYKTNRFVGAFNWPSGTNSSVIVLLTQSQWRRTNLTLLELSSSGKFILARKAISWQSFFGCYHKIGHSQRWQSTDNRESAVARAPKRSGVLNVCTISILVLLAFIICLVVFAVARNVKFGAIKLLLKRLLGFPPGPISPIDNNCLPK